MFRKIQAWLQIRATIAFNTSIIALCVLLIFQGVTLLYFLPKLVGHPDTFPISAKCHLTNKTLIDNLCSTSDDLSQGGLESYWQLCRIAQYEATYHVDEQIFDINQTNGDCLYWFPDTIEQSGQILPEVGLNYSCWLDLVSKQCYLIFPEATQNTFVILQAILGVIWVMVLSFTCYSYQIYQKRSFEITIEL